MAEELIKVPDIGGAEGAEVVEVLVSPGDTIDVEQSLVVVESDKASMEIPAPVAGVVGVLRVAVGDSVSEGDVILTLEATIPSKSDDTAPTGAPEEAVAETESPAPETDASAAAPLQGAPLDAAASAMLLEDQHASSAVTMIEVTIPDLGSDQGADLVEILVPAGTEVQEGDSLVLLESDKASMEVPAPSAGVLTEWLVETGATVREGVVIAAMAIRVGNDSPDQTPGSGPSEAVDSEASHPVSTLAAANPAAHPASPEPASLAQGSVTQRELTPAESGATVGASGSDAGAVYAGPAVRKLAREFGVSLTHVTGTGSRGRILKEDLQQYVSRTLAGEGASGGAGLPTIPDQDFTRFGSIDRIARSRIDKLTATNMVRSWLNVPHVTQFDDADIHGMERFRKELKSEAGERGVRLTPLPFILKACAVALRDHPKLKSSLADNGDTLIMKHYCHIGMAVDTPAGLVVPVIRDVDKKSIWELAAEIATLADKARDKQLTPTDMQGGVFTVSSLGAIGGRGFTPIINVPEVAILGVGRAAVQPVWDGEVFRPHTLLPLALSYDHRVVNGGDGGRFLTDVTALLADVKRMVM